MVSPEVQRTSIEDYCRARGYQLDAVVEGLDESGSRARSAWWPRLEQACAAVEAGTYDVVVVWKFSRTARHRLRWATALDRVETVGGRLESATEQVDVTTSTGRFTRGMLAELNAFEAERIGEVWSEVHARRVRNGLPPTGKPKWGYSYDRAAKIHRPDPATGPVLATLYRRYTAGESVYALVRWLNSHGHYTLAGGLWSDHTLRRVLDSGFASGQVPYKGQLHPGIHEALISEGEWQAYVDARDRRRQRGRQRERSQYLLSGLIRCARCGRPMVAGQFGDHRQPKYRCKTSKEQGPEACLGGYITAKFVEEEVRAWLEELAGEVDTAHAAALEAKAHRAVVRSDVARLSRQVATAEAALARLVTQRVKLAMPDAVFRASYDELTSEHASLQSALEEAQRQQRADPGSPRRAARTLLEGWDDKPVSMRREELGALVRAVMVTTGRPKGTIEIVPAWADPDTGTSL